MYAFNMFGEFLKLLSAPNCHSDVTSNDVQFILHTREGSRQIYLENLTGINPNLPFKFLIHGWSENIDMDAYNEMIEAYLNRGNYNVVAVNWSNPAYCQYEISVLNTRKVGKLLAALIIELNRKGVSLRNIHLIGHSLGSHVAGFAGKEVISKTGQQIQRITGLDPAGPLFEVVSLTENNRLSKNDAYIVDAIHTDGGFLGYLTPLGTVDFYMNGGMSLQPRCTTADPVFCSHQKSREYYTKSINTPMVARKCGSLVEAIMGLCQNTENTIFGENLLSNAQGTFFVDTIYSL